MLLRVLRFVLCALCFVLYYVVIMFSVLCTFEILLWGGVYSRSVAFCALRCVLPVVEAVGKRKRMDLGRDMRLIERACGIVCHWAPVRERVCLVRVVVSVMCVADVGCVISA